MEPLRIEDLFHPHLAAWFRESFGAATDIQKRAWPVIASGEHALIQAPTGSGKTLTAFLWALDRLARGAWSPGATRVLYVSPLRALNNDIQRNLVAPLGGIRERFASAGEAPPAIRVATRSGDTPPGERRRMIANPPEILITTPESLNILLTTRAAETLFSGLQTVILDEVHALAGSKRGTHLISAVERLDRLAGGFQRIALSATIRPAARVARWLGGRDDAGRDRPVAVLASRAEKAYDLRVELVDPQRAASPESGDIFFDALARAAEERIAANRSTLIFANSRRTVERVARLINHDGQRQAVWAHHGSLSREIRQSVEERLKAGRLAGIVATNSLELGIDIGEVDEVLLVQSPPSITAAVQRIGRAGHGVGQVSRARLYPAHPRDLLDAAVIAAALTRGEIEPLAVPADPLDVLAQVILSMTVTETWAIDDLYAFVTRMDPYRQLSRTRFDLVIDMLAGRYAGVRLPSLQPRLAFDRIAQTVRARPGVARLLFMAGGTIPDRGQFNLRLAESRARIGTLDEEFVWERSEGDVFTLGVQSWRIQRITHNDVLVTPAGRGPSMSPFWRAEARDSDAFLAERMGLFLARADADLLTDTFRADLIASHHLAPDAADALIDFLGRQKRATGSALPHRQHLLIERVSDPQGQMERPLLILHTTWGGRVNRPLALALAEAVKQRRGVDLDVNHDDHCVVVAAEEGLRPEEILSLLDPAQVEPLVRARLGRSGFFGARFRECAGRAVLLPRAGFGRRTPLWLSRQRAKELLAAVADQAEFPIVLEAFRTCLEDEMDLPRLSALLAEVADGAIAITAVHTSRPSPLAAEVIWKRTNSLMYEDDQPLGDPARVRPALLDEVVHSAWLRPRLAPAVIAEFAEKVQRVHPGYAPADGPELIEWLKERLILPAAQWQALLAAVWRDHGLAPDSAVAAVAQRVVFLQGPDGVRRVCALEMVPRLCAALALDPAAAVRPLSDPDAPPAALMLEQIARLTAGRAPADPENERVDLVAEWLRHAPPMTFPSLAEALGLTAEQVGAAVRAGLEGDEAEEHGLDPQLVVGPLSLGASEAEVCDAANLERLLRLTRARARPAVQARPLSAWPAFLAARHGLGEPGGDEGDLAQRLESLFGFPAPADQWEGEILPARLAGYRPAWLDALLAGSDLVWLGCGRESVTFCLAGDRPLFPPAPLAGEDDGDAQALLDRVLPVGSGRFGLAELARAGDPDTGRLTHLLWRAAWRGQVINDTFAALRRGVDSGFAPEAKPDPGRAGRRRFGRWWSERPFPGTWQRLDPPLAPEDALAEDDVNRERVRVLLARYGVLFRQLLARELPDLGWGRLFRSLRLMEFSGEVLAGVFFAGLDGPQFASPEALRALRADPDPDRIWWCAATDPASPCGLGLEGLAPGRLTLPRRVPSNHLVFEGDRLRLVSERHGRALRIDADPTHPRLGDLLALLAHLLERRRTVVIETIDDRPAAEGAWRTALAERFAVEAADGVLRLGKRY